ncbi:MAG: tail fiber domain-containing protein [Acidobacteriota bacterium]|nr:tail fiber domain-containing protein [Acidobacteriota bacterium]
MYRARVVPLFVLALFLLVPTNLMAAPPAGTIVDVQYYSGGLVFEPVIGHDGIDLTVTGPRKFSFVDQFRAGAGGSLDIRDFADGLYRWEVRALPKLDPEVRAQIAQARKDNDMQFICDLQDAGVLPFDPLVQGGAFSVYRGKLVDLTLNEDGFKEGNRETDRAAAGLSSTSGALTNLTEEDEVILDDLIVDGSACIGFDCVNGETFGFDTLRLKENNLRIKFDDTSVAASFPRNDWELVANDSANGGRSKFTIRDSSNDRDIFTVEASARSNALFVDSQGDVGLGTSSPVADIHVVTGDSPTLRLAQDGSSGFAPQTWDLAGNETNFFIRDSSNGSTLPFRLRPGAPTNSIFIDVDGDISFGTQSPDADVRFQVQAHENNNFGGLRVENSGTGNIQTQFANTDGGWEWRQTFRSGDLIFDSQEDGANEWEVDIDGNVTATSFNPTSDRNLKQGFDPVDPADVLERLAAIPVTRWSYRGDADATPHIGPVAQDFHAAFGVGADDRHISTTDADGVAFAAIQALYQQLQETRAELEKLRAETIQGCEP